MSCCHLQRDTRLLRFQKLSTWLKSLLTTEQKEEQKEEVVKEGQPNKKTRCLMDEHLFAVVAETGKTGRPEKGDSIRAKILTKKNLYSLAFSQFFK